MGSIQSKIKENSRAVTVIASMILIGGVYYYVKKKDGDIDINQTQMKLSDPSENLDEYKFEYIAHEPQLSISQETIIKRGTKGQRFDRRHKVIADKRRIIQCIGRITSFNENDKNSDGIYKPKVSTGTVFDVFESPSLKKTFFFVITCAHSAFYTCEQRTKVYDNVWFFTIETLPGEGKFRRLGEYKMVNAYALKGANGQYLYKGQQNELDLAILVFEDTDGYYNGVLNNGDDNPVKLFSAHKLRSPKSLLYSIYGFPLSKVNQLYGMSARHSNDANFMEVWDGKLYSYNVIDTEGGQSGAAIFVELKDKYAIVGVHIATAPAIPLNFGVVLTKQNVEALSIQMFAKKGCLW